ncbi:stage III sporulation protein AF [Cohnella thailandensis]|uniref:Stage III sporulation protein AF n=1 Tax=Cohnella thailandensis TaxID=557557 RepID=A0A841T357_9BACL|nr:stage III sporulation protein AF [Cohnella thailandensis]MBB6635531.1 stage III sporulation protein AF [Cohnella thailandensis]MBP1974911.1 stage III sporulation protein AF [Cohnella thailandensis]
MMAALTEWLKQIIAVILLASLVDLLLPNQTMQRYIRLIAGLFILLALVGPMLSWIKSDFGTKLAADLEAVRQRPENAAEQLAQIEEDASKLRMSREEQAASLASAGLAAQIKETVEKEAGAGVRDVQVQTETDAEGVARVQAVSIVLRDAAGDKSDSESDREETAPIREVEPVVIDLDSIGKEDDSQEKELPAMSEEETEEEKQLKRRIASLVSARYGMGTEQIDVELENGGTEQTKS